MTLSQAEIDEFVRLTLERRMDVMFPVHPMIIANPNWCWFPTEDFAITTLKSLSKKIDEEATKKAGDSRE